MGVFTANPDRLRRDLLLLLKALFQDKLPPKWQFAVWSVLALMLRCSRQAIMDAMCSFTGKF